MSDGEVNIQKLWPTSLLSVHLPGCAQANPILQELLLSKDNNNEQMTTDYLSDDLFALEHPVVKWLKLSCERAVLDYVRSSGIGYELEFSIQAWANVNRMGDYHNLHNHPHSYLSGTYYITVPVDEMLPSGRDDRTHNAISFFDPRPQANMMAIRGDESIDPEHRVIPVSGLLMVWPSYLHHAVHPNLSHDPRISVSFNVVLNSIHNYLPSR